MRKSILWLVVSGLMALSLVLAACGPTATPTAPTTPTTPTTPTAPTTPTTPTQEKPQQEAVKPAPEGPKYGGTLTFAQNGDQSDWRPERNITGRIIGALYQQLWEGDWSRGPAGGYGTNEVDWGMGNSDLFEYKMGFIAESTKWTIDEAKNQGTIVYQVRPGVTYNLNSASEASRLVNGREVTADDVVYVLKRATTWNLAYIYSTNIELRNADIQKTGPREVTVKLPLEAFYTGIIRFGDSVFFYPPEVVTKYGDMSDWKNAVGTGPFIVTENVPGSAIVMKRSPNYWGIDPVGPGKGNQLPYIDTFRMLVIPDASTRLAALRTGKIDHMTGLTSEDAIQLRKQVPSLLERVATSAHGRGTPLLMRIDRAPFSDIRVRKAMMMAVDFQSILKNYRGGVGQILTYPASKITPYDKLYLDLDAPDFPEEAKELYSYNPEKSKQLLKEAGYPSGFKTEILITSTEADYYSIIKDYFARVGIDMKLDIVESSVKSAVTEKREHKAMSTATTGPIAQFTSGFTIQGVAATTSV
ncbi:MAG: ABC transporter substrate-binding protein [Chloroflexi bacterium]|nr:ABC transporter substrate-binding protein [Chloroflexota bacterium]